MSVDKGLSYAVVAVLVAAWIVLVVTLPKAVHRTLTLDVVCTSGQPPVGVWVESASGGSGWAQRGEGGATVVRRFVYQQEFEGPFEAHVGCGGTTERWGIEARSSQLTSPYRRLTCDDAAAAPPEPAPCRDR
jgi:hypothetical protein